MERASMITVTTTPLTGINVQARRGRPPVDESSGARISSNHLQLIPNKRSTVNFVNDRSSLPSLRPNANRRQNHPDEIDGGRKTRLRRLQRLTDCVADILRINTRPGTASRSMKRKRIGADFRRLWIAAPKRKTTPSMEERFRGR